MYVPSIEIESSANLAGRNVKNGGCGIEFGESIGMIGGVDRRSKNKKMSEPRRRGMRTVGEIGRICQGLPDATIEFGLKKSAI